LQKALDGIKQFAIMNTYKANNEKHRRDKMAKLTIESLNHSREAGMVTVSGKNYLEVAKKLGQVEGVEGVEHDEDNGEYVFTYNKLIIDELKLKAVFKSLK
jgi:hypothetical protein